MLLLFYNQARDMDNIVVNTREQIIKSAQNNDVEYIVLIVKNTDSASTKTEAFIDSLGIVTTVAIN